MFQATARYELSVRKFTDLSRTSAELESATASEMQRRFAAAMLTEAAYYDVLAQGELTRVARERMDRASEQLGVARARVETGAAVQTDSLEVRLEFTRSRVGLRIRETALSVARLELGRRIGLAGPADAVPLDTLRAPDLPITLPDAISRALEQGPEYRVARANERASKAFLKGQQGAYLPVIALDRESFPFRHQGVSQRREFFFAEPGHTAGPSGTMASASWQSSRPARHTRYPGRCVAISSGPRRVT